MRTRVLMLLLTGIITAFGITGSAMANEEASGLLDDFFIPLSINADVAVYSSYIWRGFTLDDDPVIQPGVSIGAYGLTASFWSSFDIIADDDVDSDEVDFTLDYTYDHDLFSASVGHTWYTFPAANTDTQEFYIGGAVNIPVMEELTLSPGFKWFYDYGDVSDGGAKGSYFLVDLGHSIPIPVFGKEISLDLYNSVSYNRELFIAGDGGEYLASIGLTLPLYDHVTLSPSASYSIPFGDLADTDDGNQDDRFYFGTTLAFEF